MEQAILCICLITNNIRIYRSDSGSGHRSGTTTVPDRSRGRPRGGSGGCVGLQGIGL